MIILTILKWLGIFLLCVLALLLMLCLCILFVPVRYHVYVTCENQWKIRGVVSWMLHILHLSFDTVTEKGMQLRIFGFDVSVGKRRKKAAKAPESHNTSSQTETARGVAETSEPEMMVAEEKQISQERVSAEKEKAKLQKNKEKSRFLLYRSPMRNFFLSIRGIFDRIKSVDREGLEIVRLLLKNGGKLLRHILPRKIRGRIHFGTSDPAQTGEILGAVSVLFAMYGQGIRIVPDFDQAVFEGEAELQGHLRGIVLLILVIRMHPLQLMSYLDRR